MSYGTDAIERDLEKELRHIAPSIHVVFEDGEPVVSTEPNDLSAPDLILLHTTDAKALLYGMKNAKAITDGEWLEIVKHYNAAEGLLRNAVIRHRVSTACDNGNLEELRDELDLKDNLQTQATVSWWRRWLGIG